MLLRRERDSVLCLLTLLERWSPFFPIIHHCICDAISWDSWPQLTRGTFQTLQHHTQHLKLGEEGRRGWSLYRSGYLCLFQSVMEPSFPGDGFPWEEVNEFLALLCSHMWLSPHLFNSTHEFSLCYLSNSLSHPTWGVSSGAELPAGVKPWHKAQHKSLQRDFQSYQAQMLLFLV